MLTFFSALFCYMTSVFSFFILSFFFNDTATTEIYTLSLHDALPIYGGSLELLSRPKPLRLELRQQADKAKVLAATIDRKSTRLNSSHLGISYAVFCLKKKKKIQSDEL